METVQIRWLGTKKNKIVDLPIGLMAAGEKTGEVLCNPVGEFPADQAKKLLAMPGASALYVPEREYQAKLNPKSDVAKEEIKEKQRERGRKLAAAQAAKRAKKEAQKGSPAPEDPNAAAGA